MRSTIGHMVWLASNRFPSLYGGHIALSVPHFPCLTFLQITFAFQADFSAVVSMILVL